MISLFLLHIVITVICSLSGVLFYGLVTKDKEHNKPLIFYPVTGLIIITMVSQVAVLFFAVNGYFTVCVLVILFCLALIKRKDVVAFYSIFFAYLKERSTAQWLLAAALWLMILLLNAGPTMMDDTESYHIQAVKWINEYGTVPGIANLHERFGFNSSWFTSVSFFLPPAGGPNFYSMLNGVISTWLGVFLIFQLKPSEGSGKRKQVSGVDFGIMLVLLLSLACWAMLRGNASTANYDFITATLILILFIKILQQGRQGRGNAFTVELIIWPVHLFTVRIVNYPLLLLSLFGFYLLIKNKEWRRLILLCVLSACLFIAFVTRNVILSGYPFYPSAAFDFFYADWKADEEMLTYLKRYIKYFNRVNEGYLSIEETEKLRFPVWIRAWFHYLFYYDKPVVVAGLSSVLLHLVFIKRSFSIYNALTRFFIIVIFAQLLSWFFIAPDPRFVYGPLLCCSLLLPVLILKNKTINLRRRTIDYLLICMAGLLFVFTILKFAKNENYRNYLLPRPLPRPPVKTVVVDNIELRVPEKILNNWNARCYDVPLPCLYRIDPRLRARGKSIREGFRLEK